MYILAVVYISAYINMHTRVCVLMYTHGEACVYLFVLLFVHSPIWPHTHTGVKLKHAFVEISLHGSALGAKTEITGSIGAHQTPNHSLGTIVAYLDAHWSLASISIPVSRANHISI